MRRRRKIRHLEGVDDDGGGVVMPSALQGGGHKELGRALRRAPGRQHGGDGLVVELVTESVGADEEPVPGGHRNAVEVRDAGVGDATAQRPGDDVAAGVAARLLGGELAGLDENLNPGVVASDLGERCLLYTSPSPRD